MFTQLKVALIRKMAHKRLGKDIAPLETIATHPDFLVAYAQFSQALDKTNLVSAKLKKLAQIRAASCWNAHFELTSTRPAAGARESVMTRSGALTGTRKVTCSTVMRNSSWSWPTPSRQLRRRCRRIYASD